MHVHRVSGHFVYWLRNTEIVTAYKSGRLSCSYHDMGDMGREACVCLYTLMYSALRPSRRLMPSQITRHPRTSAARPKALVPGSLLKNGWE